MHRLFALAGPVATADFGVAGQASAHDHLLSAHPAADAMVAAPPELVLRFREKMVEKFSGSEVVKADGAKAPVQVKLATERKDLVGTPTPLLSPGTYKVTWRAVSVDARRLEDAYAFTVR